MNYDASSLRIAIGKLSSSGSEKLQIARELVWLSGQKPETLLPQFDSIAELLDAENNIIKWTGFQIIANLAAVERKGRIDATIERYLAPIAGPVMITAGHAIHGSAKIAATHPHRTGRIVRAILGVEHARYKTDECRNIAIGHAITALGTMSDDVRKAQDVIAFVTRQRENHRAATSKKASRFLQESLGRAIRPARRIRVH